MLRSVLSGCLTALRKYFKFSNNPVVKAISMSELNPGNDSTSALLMCGDLPWLLETRRRVLEQAGFVVDCLSCPSEVEARLTVRRYEVLLICHTMDEPEVEMLKGIACRADVPSYCIEPLTPPEALIGDIQALMQSTAKIECGSEAAARHKASA
jgi:hypothetical protein